MSEDSGSPGMKRTLGLTGVTVNAMALIAPGAFLWMTYQLQAANLDVNGNSTAPDMWTGIVGALIVAFLTAFAYAELARRYPEAGTGSAYYFSEKAFLDREKPSHRRWSRIFKFVTGWAAHLFYWVYPGVMVAFMVVLLTYIAGQFGLTIPLIGQIVIAWLFAALVGYIGYRGITGSTNVAIAINVIQLTMLVVFSVLAIAFRNTNPLHIAPTGWYQPDAASIVNPFAAMHTLAGLLFQSTIAILILVGFESSTALAAEAKDPRRDIPRGVILSLVIQGLLAYLFEYFAANYALGSWLSGDVAGRGIAAAAASGAPIGDMAIQIGNAMLGGNGFALMMVMAISVGIAILGTTLAAMNTGVRITFAMAQDKEMPEVLGALHGRFATPHMALLVMVIVSAIIGSVGLLAGTVTLTGITLASNLGTFILYGLICAVAIVAFAGRAEFHRVRHLVVPVLGIIGNIIMVAAIFIVGIASGGTTAQATYLGLGISGIWLVVSVLYLVITSRRSGTPIVPSVEALTPKGVGD